MENFNSITNDLPKSDMDVFTATGGSKNATDDNGGIGLLFSTSYPAVMTLNIGGRKFQTQQSTLRSSSGLFRRQLSENYSWRAQADGSYFMDADPDLFAHLLRFMRRPAVFPLFYTKANGFDYDLYNRLEVEAEYFQIDELCDWIREKKYLKAVVTQTHSARVHPLGDVALKNVPIHHDEDRYVVPRTRKVYLCPRDIFVHRGDRNKCGAACRKAQGDREDEYEEEHYVEVVTVEKETQFLDAVCKLE
jgi:hypothetical protein